MLNIPPVCYCYIERVPFIYSCACSPVKLRYITPYRGLHQQQGVPQAGLAYQDGGDQGAPGRSDNFILNLIQFEK